MTAVQKETVTAEGLSRREVLAASAGAFVLGFFLPGAGDAEAATDPAQFNAYVKIRGDDKITLMFGGLEFGQGAMTGLTQILAEELKADWSKVSVQQADSSPISYLTGGSGGAGPSSSSNPAGSAGVIAAEPTCHP